LPEAEQKFQKRQTAYKIRIKDILDSRYIKTEGFEPNYLEINGQEVSRVNIMGVIVGKSEQNNQKTLIIEDGSEKISARVFENTALLDSIDVENIVLLTGRPREFSSEKYILIETIKKIDPAWVKVRKLELKTNIADNKLSSEDAALPNNKSPVEESIVISPANKLIKLIKEFDKGDGVSVEDISSKGIQNIDVIINRLLKEGDIFEIKPGKLKVLE
jgi:RPA family protein